MESMEQRVWQRVFSQPEQEIGGLSLGELALQAQEAAAVYRRMLQEASGKRRELLKRLLEAECANLACLKGLHLLSGSDTRKLLCAAAGRAGEGRPEACYRSAHCLLLEYTARSAQPQFGVVFQEMARRQAQSCGILAELLGSGRG